ncbi:GNAT family N-acetyltransferase [Limoniibacter endophyticus]|uniref:N-acetyltransferase n=1 Tax=Limoniibacter endophyticus TaxID=1565040 RepID=A0A8J3GHK0_9HYPH|nr:GNAT family N-acetyltransferase [Limoniibacter endophyticus]GHC75381.1 N-acetyltransferase [Limoniibacter endophyticus]
MTEIATTDRLTLRLWQDEDRAFFHRLNSDPGIMTYFPRTLTRGESDAVMDRINAEYALEKFCLSAVALRETGELIGFVGLHRVTGPAPMPTGAVEIGWRLAPEFWQKGYASEAAWRWLQIGFEDLGIEEIVSFAVAANEPSLATMRRLGLHHDVERDFDHPFIEENQAHLRPHRLFALTRDEWLMAGA